MASVPDCVLCQPCEWVVVVQSMKDVAVTLEGNIRQKWGAWLSRGIHYRSSMGQVSLHSDHVLFTVGQFVEVLSFLRQTVHTILEWPRFPGTITAEVVLWLCVRSGTHLMKTAVRYQLVSPSVAIPSTFCPRTQHVCWTPVWRSPGERPH